MGGHEKTTKGWRQNKQAEKWVKNRRDTLAQKPHVEKRKDKWEAPNATNLVLKGLDCRETTTVFSQSANHIPFSGLQVTIHIPSG